MAHSHKNAVSGKNGQSKSSEFKFKEPSLDEKPATQAAVQSFATYMNGLKARNASNWEKSTVISKQSGIFAQKGFDSETTRQLFQTVVGKHTPKQTAGKAVETQPNHGIYAPTQSHLGVRAHFIHIVKAAAVAGAIVAAGIFAINNARNNFRRELKKTEEIREQIRRVVSSVPEDKPFETGHVLEMWPADPEERKRAKEISANDIRRMTNQIIESIEKRKETSAPEIRAVKRNGEDVIELPPVFMRAVTPEEMADSKR